MGVKRLHIADAQHLDNYVYRTSGRSPALSGSTLFHAVSSVFENNNGHAIEGTRNGEGLFRGMCVQQCQPDCGAAARSARPV